MSSDTDASQRQSPGATTARSKASQEATSRALAFVESQHEYYLAYHNHKESMAYAGFTLYAGAVGAALFTNVWPPKWGAYGWVVAAVAASVFWRMTLSYLKFQLLRRRWAALRRAGCERLLARWILEGPTNAELAVAPRGDKRELSQSLRLRDYIFPHPGAIHVFDTEQTVYPQALAGEWLILESSGTAAIVHEEILILSGWLLYFALLAKTFL